MGWSRHQLIDGLRTLQAAETGTLFKQARLNVAMCYPSPYHVGMSSLGFQTIYREVHAHPQATAERVFLPDDVDAWRAARAVPSSIETQRPLDRFDLLAFSVAYELEVTGVFELLESSGFPALREARTEAMPLVVAGGPLTFAKAKRWASLRCARTGSLRGWSRRSRTAARSRSRWPPMEPVSGCAISSIENIPRRRS